MSATDQMRQMLDQLMGTTRNGKLKRVNIVSILFFLFGQVKQSKAKLFHIMQQFSKTGLLFFRPDPIYM